MIVPVILCGGSGTRLWPLSRQQHPNQFLPLVNEHTLLQNTIRRLNNFESMADPVVLCHESHRFIVAEQLRQIGCRPAAIILEPVGRNTAPAVTVAALHALKQGKNSILLVLPADHHIKDIKRFHRALSAGAQLATKRHLITFGILPTSAETGYGYIHKGEPIVISTQMEASAFLERDQFQVKQITLKPGAKISLQKHFHRAEHWVLVRGTAKIVKGEEKFTLEQNESTYIPPGVYHQLENPGQHPLDLIEIQTGRYLQKDDVTRSENTHTG